MADSSNSLLGNKDSSLCNESDDEKLVSSSDPFKMGIALGFAGVGFIVWCMYGFIASLLVIISSLNAWF